MFRTALIDNRASGQLCLALSDHGKQLALGAGDDRCRAGGGHVHVHSGALSGLRSDQLEAFNGGGPDLLGHPGDRR